MERLTVLQRSSMAEASPPVASPVTPPPPSHWPKTLHLTAAQAGLIVNLLLVAWKNGLVTAPEMAAVIMDLQSKLDALKDPDQSPPPGS